MATFTGSLNGVTVTIEVPDDKLEAIRHAQDSPKLGQQHFDGVREILDMKVRDAMLTVATALAMPNLAAAVLAGTMGEYKRLNEGLTALAPYV